MTNPTRGARDEDAHPTELHEHHVPSSAAGRRALVGVGDGSLESKEVARAGVWAEPMLDVVCDWMFTSDSRRLGEQIVPPRREGGAA